MAKRYINITFPFQNSDNGFFVKLNSTDANAVKSDLMHLILTQKGERLYDPEFGTNLLKFIFEPQDGYTFAQIEEEINTVVARFLPKLTINKVYMIDSEENDHLAIIRIDYTINDDVFSAEDFVIIKI
jgi:phage baseplate assembly protein W